MLIKSVLREKVKHGDICMISPHVTVKEAAQALVSHEVGALLVSENGLSHIKGIISERDIVIGLAKSADQCFDVLVSDVMSTPVQYCHEEDRIEVVSELMTNKRIRHVPVLDAGDKLVGIVSIGDIVKSSLDHAKQDVDHLKHYVATSR